MAALRAGLLGAGSMGRHHARLLREIEGVDLVAVVDGNGDRYGVAGDAPVLADLDEALDLGLDIAVAAVPTAAHEAVAVWLAQAGVNVLVEKPMALSVAACQLMAREFRRFGVFGAVGHVERFNPAVRELKRLIGAGVVGEIRQISTRRLGPFSGRISDVGVGLDLASHDVDLVSWLSGSEYRRVYAQSRTAPGHEHEGMLSLLGVLSDDVAVANTVSWHSALRERAIIVTGDDGVLMADTATSTLLRYDGGPNGAEPIAVGAYEPLRAELEAFRDGVLGQATDIATFEDGLAAVSVVATALDSAASGEPIQLARVRTA
jgi:UDP-N-acetylglucosamine 3-dehydrogenase